MNKIVEYMAMSRPIVSFDLREARVSAGDAAVYASPNDVARLRARASASSWPRPSDASRWARRAADASSEELSWEHSETQLLAAYDRALGKRAASRGHR